MKKYRNEWLIFFGAMAIYLMFNWLLPITDPVESNYALTAKEMLQSGDWLSMRIYGQYWYDKPILIYWTLIASYQVFGISAFAARFPMAVASAASLSFIFWFACKLYGRKVAWISVGILATCLEFWVIGKVVITDSFLFLFDGVALGLFFLGMRTERWRYYAVGYAAAGLAVLTKGPVGIVLPGLIILSYFCWNRQLRVPRLYIGRGILIFSIVALPWYTYMTLVHGSEFVAGFLGLNNMTRAMVSEHPDQNVWYYYLIVMPLCTLPWTGIFLRSLYRAAREKIKSCETRFFLCWIGVTILFYSLMATKYITYTFIVLFPAAIFMALCIAEMLEKNVGRRTWLWVTGPAMLMLVLLPIGSVILMPDSSGIICAIFTAAFLALLYLQLQGTGRQLLFGVVTGCFALVIGLGGTALPEFAKLRSTDITAALPDDPEAKIAMYGTYQASAVFYSGHVITRLQNENADNAAWSEKYKMPTQNLGSFLDSMRSSELVYLIVPKKEAQHFMQKDFSSIYQLIWSGRDSFIYRKIL